MTLLFHTPAACALALSLCALTSTASAGDTPVFFLSSTPQTLALTLGSGDGSFHRPRQNCTELSGSGATQVNYDTVSVFNPNPVALSLDVRTQPPGGDGSATCDAARDTVMMAYSGGFDAALPLQNCIAYNDDAAGSPNLDRCSRISGVTVPAQGSVTLVVAAYANGDSYPYDLRFDGTTLADRLFADGFDGTPPSLPSGGTLYAAHAVSGQVDVGGVVAPLPPTSRVDAIIGAQGAFAGMAQLAPIALSGTTSIGLLGARLQWIDLGGGTGTAPVGAAATLQFPQMQLRLQSVTLNGAPVPIGGECRFSPVNWTMTGAGSASSIDVSAAQFTIPPSSDACGGWAAQLNNLFGGTDNGVQWSVQR